VGVTATWGHVLLDASCIISFCQAGHVAYLHRFLDRRGYITEDVEREVGRNAASQHLVPRMRWPCVLPHVPELLSESVRLARASQGPGDHPKKNLGEISTTLMAQHLGNAGVIMDDQYGKHLCDQRGVARISTPQLVGELVVARAIPPDDAASVLVAALPDRATTIEIQRRIDYWCRCSSE